MDWTDMQNWVTATCAVLTLLGAGATALHRVCAQIKTARESLGAQIAAIQQQNVLQSEQIKVLGAAVTDLQHWMMGRGEGGR